MLTAEQILATQKAQIASLFDLGQKAVSLPSSIVSLTLMPPATEPETTQEGKHSANGAKLRKNQGYKEFHRSPPLHAL